MADVLNFESLKNMYWVVEIRIINCKKCKMNKLLDE